MDEHVLEREQVLQVPLERAFEVFADAGNLESLTPPSLRFRIVTPQPIEMEVGTLIAYRLRMRGLPISWITRIAEWNPPHGFVDEQLRGPYALWHHTHTLEARGDDATMIRDRVRYKIGFGPLGDISHRLFVKAELDRIFDFRLEAIHGLLPAEGVAAPASS
ncbi:SRPBCC family protein [Thermoleophilia bacterium SCSIO 60948]|nr:SRPBCC family protein [Thermoleophilia bacterium SCSIO 60948]